MSQNYLNLQILSHFPSCIVLAKNADLQTFSSRNFVLNLLVKKIMSLVKNAHVNNVTWQIILKVFSSKWIIRLDLSKYCFRIESFLHNANTLHETIKSQLNLLSAFHPISGMVSRKKTLFHVGMFGHSIKFLRRISGGWDLFLLFLSLNFFRIFEFLN